MDYNSIFPLYQINLNSFHLDSISKFIILEERGLIAKLKFSAEKYKLDQLVFEIKRNETQSIIEDYIEGLTLS